MADAPQPAIQPRDGVSVVLLLARTLLLLPERDLREAVDALQVLRPRDGELLYGILREVLYLRGWRLDDLGLDNRMPRPWDGGGR